MSSAVYGEMQIIMVREGCRHPAGISGVTAGTIIRKSRRQVIGIQCRRKIIQVAGKTLGWGLRKCASRMATGTIL